MILAEAGTDPQLFQYLGVFFLTLVVIAFAVGSMLASKLAGWYFGARKAKALGRHTPTKDTPYECGMLPVGDGSSRKLEVRLEDEDELESVVRDGLLSAADQRRVRWTRELFLRRPERIADRVDAAIEQAVAAVRAGQNGGDA